ncbi:hypothetical protein [Haloechinothrix salitolerans]|uniref:TrkA-N domain-containing protein n=1 Tax=Haloechinothrix salitolerans TaxID=926830 RepID=A0ABW2C725_9PSEU
MARADAGTVDPQRVLLVGAGSLSAAVAEQARRWGSTVRHLPSPSDEELRETLARGWDVVAVVTHDDILALRYALLVEHIRPGIRLLVTIFDRTVGGEVVRSVPNCTVLAMTDALVPALLGPCVAEHLLSLHRIDDDYLVVAGRHDAPSLACVPAKRIVRRKGLAARLIAQCRPHDATSRALLVGLAGLATVLLLDVVLGVLVLHESVTEAFWHAARVLTTVGSSDAATHAAPWYHAVSALTMLAALAFAALFTAGLVDRMTSHRLTGIIGGRAVSRRGPWPRTSASCCVRAGRTTSSARAGRCSASPRCVTSTGSAVRSSPRRRWDCARAPRSPLVLAPGWCGRRLTGPPCPMWTSLLSLSQLSPEPRRCVPAARRLGARRDAAPLPL